MEESSILNEEIKEKAIKREEEKLFNELKQDFLSESMYAKN